MKPIRTTVKSTFPQIYKIDYGNRVRFEISIRSRKMGLHYRKFPKTEKEARELIKTFEKKIHEQGAASMQKNVSVIDSAIAGYVERLAVYHK